MPHQVSEIDYDDDYDESGPKLVSQDVVKQSRMPSVKDSNLWILRCKPGDEFHVSSLLMNKYVAAKMNHEVIIGGFHSGKLCCNLVFSALRSGLNDCRAMPCIYLIWPCRFSP